MIDDARILETARSLVDEIGVGCLSTVGPGDRPHGRYMAAVTRNDNLQWLYSLSAQATRKVEHVRHFPHVCWLFATADYQDVVTLHGRASIQPTSEMPSSVYHRLIEFAQPYAVNVTTDPHHYHFEAIVTRVESVELLAPHLSLTSPRLVQLE